MHLLGNGAQRELLTSRLLQRRLNYRTFASPDLLICDYCFRNNAVLLIMCVSRKGNKRAKWEHQQWRTVWRYPICYEENIYDEV